MTGLWTHQIAASRRRVALVGDTQSTSRVEFWRERNGPGRRRIFAELERRRPDALALLGDMVTWGSSERHWRGFDRGVSPLRAAGVPILPVLGNHDRMLWARQGERAAAQRFPWMLERTWYAWRWGDVGFFALDSGFGGLGRRRVARQAAWLEEALAAAAADSSLRALVGYWHHPPMTNSRVVRPSAEAKRRLLAPLVGNAKTVAVFSGHCHAYEHFRDPSGLHLFVSGGGGGPRQPLHTAPARRRGEDLFDGGAKRFLHFCELERAAAGLVVRVVRLDGAGFDVADTVPLPWPGASP